MKESAFPLRLARLELEAGSSALNQAESGTDSTTSNENTLPINEKINEGLSNETVNTSNAGVFSKNNIMHSPGTSALDSGTNGRTPNENTPRINQQVSESYIYYTEYHRIIAIYPK